MSGIPPPSSSPGGSDDATEGLLSGRDVRALLEALKSVAVALKEQSVPFALAGSYAVYARGGPHSRHDVDFVITEEDAPRVRQGFVKRGMTVVDPPEDWLFKIDEQGVQVDIIFRLASGPIDDDLLARADVLTVDSVRMPVLSATDLLLSKLGALGEHHCDLAPILTLVRSLREQINEDLVSQGAQGNPYAEAALVLLRSLNLLSAGSAASADTAAGARS